ncbi:hypothetical protein [Peribacillus deserti]|uniref:Glycosyltransferase RgtA/B/C/D-like domain-containing protein n=1 Tax=Peribacillus deserti TaxID=673318 RepID=A0A2N5MBR8_9BACI|nr:hypothetical protein [Peribacillus deserti]PLT31788.1 hypothetical protein CUU66_01095 [Peribacillus deserti]
MEFALKYRVKTNMNIFILSWFSLPYLITFMWLNNTKYIFNTLIFLAIMYFFVFKMIHKTSNELKMNLTIIPIIFVLKLMISIFISYVGWIPMLDTNSINFGYDPQRYYFQAYELFQNGFNINNVAQINYTGIIYYYSLIFGIVGHNPIIPLLVNSFTTLITCLYLLKIIKFCYPNVKNTSAVGLFMLLPEIIWYDILTSRESICMALLTVSIYKLIEILFIDKKLVTKKLLLFIFTVLMLGIIRTSLLLPIVILFFMYWLFINYKQNNKKSGFILVLIISALLLIIPSVTSSIGSYNFHLENVVDRVSTNTVEDDSNLNWSNNSIGKLLVADNFIENVILTPLRVFVYLMAPLPSINVDIVKLFNNDWAAWQNLLTVMSSLIYIFSLPLIFAAIIEYIKSKNKSNLVMVFLPILILMITIAAGTQIIHERYRIIAVPFIYAVILIGKNSKKGNKRLGLLIWFCILIGMGLSYSILKLI